MNSPILKNTNTKPKTKIGRVTAKKQMLVGQRTREMIKEENVRRLEESRRKRAEQRMREQVRNHFQKYIYK